MTEQPTGSEADRCPWCSSDKGGDAQGRCLSCGASLTPDLETGPVPGVTDVDTIGIIKQRTVRPTNRIVAWVTGDSPETEEWTPAGEALDQPSIDVQREMLRLEFDAAIAAQQAEIDALQAEEALAAAERAARQKDVPASDVEGTGEAGTEAAGEGAATNTPTADDGATDASITDAAADAISIDEPSAVDPSAADDGESGEPAKSEEA